MVSGALRARRGRFDLDRTLIRGSSLSSYGRELVRRGLVPRSTVARHALLEPCGTAVAVNPDPELRRRAARSGWPVVRFA